MGHHHNHAHHQHPSDRGISTAFFLNLTFTVLEIIGGLWTNSMAIIADALHDLGDSFALGLSWYLDRYSKREKDARFSYGYQRFSLLGAVINTIVLVVGGFFVLSEAIPRLMAPEHSNAQGMFAFAVVGIAVNGYAFWRLRSNKTLNAQTIGWHLLEDVLGWVAVLIVSSILMVKDIHILDPILSIMITVYVVYNVLINLKKTLAVFLQGVPEDVDVEAVEEQLKSVPGVTSAHHTHVWSLDGERHVLTTHVVVEEGTTIEETIAIKCRIKELIHTINLEHTTIEIEYSDDDCSINDACQTGTNDETNEEIKETT